MYVLNEYVKMFGNAKKYQRAWTQYGQNRFTNVKECKYVPGIYWIKPEDADNFCPYFIAGISSQGLMSTMPTQYSGQFKIGLEKHFENSILFLEYQQRKFNEDFSNDEKYNHNRKISIGVKKTF